jgi:hypothetical protein
VVAVTDGAGHTLGFWRSTSECSPKEYRAVCVCGWEGPLRTDLQRAAADYIDHVGDEVLTVTDSPPNLEGGEAVDGGPDSPATIETRPPLSSLSDLDLATELGLLDISSYGGL